MRIRWAVPTQFRQRLGVTCSNTQATAGDAGVGTYHVWDGLHNNGNVSD